MLKTVLKITIRNIPQDYVDLFSLLQKYFPKNSKRKISNYNEFPSINGKDATSYLSMAKFEYTKEVSLIDIAKKAIDANFHSELVESEITNVIVIVDLDSTFEQQIGQTDVFHFEYLLMIKNHCFYRNNEQFQDAFIIQGGNKFHFSNHLAGYIMTDDTLFLPSDKYILTAPNKSFEFSSERLAPCYIDPKNRYIYDVLRSQLFDKANDFPKTFFSHENEFKKLFFDKSGGLKNDLNFEHRIAFKAILIETIKKGLLDFINRISDNNSDDEDWIKVRNEFFARLSNVPSLALLLFSMQLEDKWRGAVLGWKEDLSKEKKLSKCEEYIEIANNALDFSYDYSDGILQLIENTISYSKGAVFSIRVYDNDFSNCDEYERGKYKKEEQKSFFRISLMDFSDNSITDTICEKTKIPLKLEDVFCFQGLKELPPDYQKIVEGDSFVVHHYGLPLFSNIIANRHGCFRVISSVQENNSYSINVNESDAAIIYSEEESFVCPSNKSALKSLPHFPGTEYDILISHFNWKNIDGNQKKLANQLSLPPIRNEEYLKKSLNTIIDFKDYFTDDFNDIVNKRDASISFQEQKEKTIDLAAEQLIDKIEKHLENKKPLDGTFVYCFDLQYNGYGSLPFGRIEMVVKTIFSVITKQKEINFAILTNDNYEIARCVRQFACFYDRKGTNSKIKNSQLFFYSPSEKGETLLGGTSDIRGMYSYNQYLRFFCGVSTNVIEALRVVANRFDENLSEPSDFKLLPFEKIRIKDSTFSANEEDDSIAFIKLRDILEHDIHDKGFGCKFDDTHIRIRGVHLDTFIEAQFIFGNQYWVDIFACHLYEKIIKNEKIDHNKKLLLIGYEIYCEPVLFTLKELLKKSIKQVDYTIYENGKYIRRDVKSTASIRHLFSDDYKDTNLCIIVGISTTLATFKEIEDFIVNSCKEKSSPSIFEIFNNVFHQSIIQICPNEKSDKCFSNIESNLFVDIDKSKKITKREISHINTDKKTPIESPYFIGIHATWRDPYDCELCFPPDYCKEKFLVETDDSSVVPQQLILPLQNDDVAERNNEKTKFVGKIGKIEKTGDKYNYDYLFYDHIDRGDNHFQYYVRTSHLIKKLLDEENNDFIEWLENIKNSINNQSLYDINILVGPLHYSNESFMCAVNKYVFDGNGYIVNFDVRKEYRSNFKVKYTNHSAIIDLIEKIRNSDPNINPSINCYYVDDHIITGNTYTRAKNLISSTFKNAFSSSDVENINIFNGIFVLLDQNSPDSRNELLQKSAENQTGDELENFFAYVDLKMPALRSYGDSCPLCAKSNQILDIYKNSILWGMEAYWNEKKYYHRIKSTQDAKNEHEKQEMFKRRNFRRLQCENEFWKGLKSEEASVEKAEKYIWRLFKEVLSINKINFAEESLVALKVEYLISYIKIMSRPVISYRENVRNAVFSILLKMFFAFECIYIKKDIEVAGKTEAGEMMLLFKVDEINKSKLALNFFEVLIARLCSLGTSALINYDRIENCRKIAEQLVINDDVEKNKNDFDWHLLVNLKKLMYSGKDSSVKVKNMLNKVLNEANKCGKLESDSFWQWLYLEAREEITDGKGDELSKVLENSAITNSNAINIINHMIDGDTKVAFYEADFREGMEIGRLLYPSKNTDIIEFQITDKLNYIGFDIVNKDFLLKFGDKPYPQLKKKSEKTNVHPVYMKITFENGSIVENLNSVKKFLSNAVSLKKAIDRDFNNNVLAAKIKSDELVTVLAARKTTTHGEWKDFNKLIDNINLQYESSNKNFDLLTVLGNLLISYVFHSLAHIAFTEKTDAADVSIKTHLNQNIKLYKVDYHKNVFDFLEEYKNSIIEKCCEKKIKVEINIDVFKCNSFTGMLSISDAISLKYASLSSIALLIDLLLNNIMEHGMSWGKILFLKVNADELEERKKITVKAETPSDMDSCLFEGAEAIYDMIVFNDMKKGDDSKNGGITTDTLEWIFNGIEPFNKSCSENAHTLGEGRYKYYENKSGITVVEFSETLEKSYVDLGISQLPKDTDSLHLTIIKNILTIEKE